MKKYLEKINNIINKIGKYNFILIIFVFIVLVLTGIYQTFSMYSESEGLKVVNGFDTYSFILRSNNETNSVKIKAKSSKYLDIMIFNDSEMELKYSLYYSSVNQDDIVVGYKKNTEYLPSGVIGENTNYYVTVKINNYSDADVDVDFGVKFGFVNGGELVLDSNENWVLEFPLLLSEVEVGSYVNYVGNNNCYDKTCDGKNLNYVDSNDMGYCHDFNSKYKVSGWRVGYVNNDSAFLVSAGAPECLCVMMDGTTSDTYCGSDKDNNWLNRDNLYILYEELNSIALKYCNSSYAKGGVCDEGTAWSMNADDFKKITNNELGLGNKKFDSLIDNGGYYWVSNSYKEFGETFYWNPGLVEIGSSTSHIPLGVRPVLYLDSSIIVIGGSGEYDDPYIISNNNI